MGRGNSILSIHQKWALAYLLWLVLLSGGLSTFGGSPGIVQAIRLRSLLNGKKEKLTQLDTELAHLRKEYDELQSNRFAQIREIRRVLGYAAQDEIVFDFSSPDQF